MGGRAGQNSIVSAEEDGLGLSEELDINPYPSSYGTMKRIFA